MALEKFPALDSNHPLFDWDDHVQSRAALVSGGQCAEFHKETWNAIVDALGDALTAAGLTWDSKYTTFDGAHITEAYGALSAAMFNSVRTNLDMLFGIGWGWSVDPTFRGYVGRKDFRGVTSGNPDDVYPEYILELTRGLNLFLEVLRGTADMAEGAYQHDVEAPFVSNLLARRSALLSFSDPSESIVRGGAVARPSAPIAVSGQVFSSYSAFAKKCLAKVLGDFWHRVMSSNDATALARIAAVLRYTGHLAKSDHVAAMDVANALYCAATGFAESVVQGGAVALPSVTMDWRGVSRATQSGEIATPKAAPIQSADQVKTAHNAAILTRDPVGVTGGDLSATEHFAVPDKLFPFYMSETAQSESAVNAVIDSAWYPPVWVDGGLYIRQSHNVTQNENGELVIL